VCCFFSKSICGAKNKASCHPGYLIWSMTFLFSVRLTDLGDFGRYWGQNKAIVGVFNGSAVPGLVYCSTYFLARALVLVQKVYFVLF
jgi:hypothetical protein